MVPYEQNNAKIGFGHAVMLVNTGCLDESLMPVARAFFFFRAEVGIRGKLVTGVQTCALPISLKIGMDILFEQEQVRLDQLLGHGGFFKTKEVGQRIMSAAMNVPVSVMETAGEGGAWGIALLASYILHKTGNQPLEAYLSEKVFANENSATITPDIKDVTGFAAFMERYKKGLVIERAAVDGLR